MFLVEYMSRRRGCRFLIGLSNLLMDESLRVQLLRLA